MDQPKGPGDMYIGDFHIVRSQAHIAPTDMQTTAYEVHDREHLCLAHTHTVDMAVDLCVLLNVRLTEPSLGNVVEAWRAKNLDSIRVWVAAWDVASPTRGRSAPPMEHAPRLLPGYTWANRRTEGGTWHLAASWDGAPTTTLINSSPYSNRDGRPGQYIATNPACGTTGPHTQWRRHMLQPPPGSRFCGRCAQLPLFTQEVTP